jgi:hypothetical protein
VSADWRGKWAVEREQLHRLLNHCRPILEKCASDPPNEVEISALAAMLHSFYNGIENIFKRIAAECYQQSPQGQAWHRGLLDLMAQPGNPDARRFLSPCLNVWSLIWIFDISFATVMSFTCVGTECKHWF